MWIPALLAIVLVAIGACLSAFAAALIAVDRSELGRRAAAGDRRASAAVRTLDRPGLELAEVHLGLVLCAVGTGAVVEPWVDAAIGSPSAAMAGAPRGWSAALALMLAIGSQVVVGQMVARSVGAQRPLGTLLSLGPPVRFVTGVLRPLSTMGDSVARRVVSRRSDDRSAVLSRIRSREDLRRLVQLSERSGTIRATDAELFDRTLRFGDKTAADAFTPRVEVESLPVDGTVGDLIDRSAATGYSRFPVHRDGLDDIVGVVHVKDVLGVPSHERRERPLVPLLRPVHAVPESKDLESLMVELREAAGQFAVVVDEYGGTAGIITLEDLIEEIVGDIVDEHDLADAVATVRRWGGAHLLAGSLHPDEVRDACGLEMPEGEYETIAGFVMAVLGRVPVERDRFHHDGWELEVVRMDGHRIRTVKVVAPSPGAHVVVDPYEGGSR